ncbi:MULTISPECIES: helix-turn-helix domain-containing protein [Bacillus]|uniref:helix-turn-helix domain-containing protein n=1 Tax=Bacillus TaxID=1386 RepID=UPI000BA68A2B|nr:MULTISPECIES: helix-turn-helix transcriptional regulator [Bacillus]MCM3278773.1 helix-turn-helix transcriptional regulator [Bacillus velezensis]MCM3349756.1 helix-turn-helix transcriptional regulator [Bacillus velezensis]MCV4329512.1 helix-turn-helix transcriptional regulator [Bacillus velezensis]MDU0077250.1 helix-turn-helix transcriptional regulator [Bacillus sp. IG2]MDU0102317.1 helix-turn-helix transcriptional regulator [Bacillus sp. IS1]
MIKFKLDKLLNEQDKTMYWLSRKTEIRPNTISKWVNNEQLQEDEKVKSINVDALNKICKVLNCKIEDIIEFIEDDSEES